MTADVSRMLTKVYPFRHFTSGHRQQDGPSAIFTSLEHQIKIKSEALHILYAIQYIHNKYFQLILSDHLEITVS